MEGGPLFDCRGAFVGMNLVPSMEKSFFLPVHLISERLKHFETTEERAVFLARVNQLKPERYVLQCFQFAFLRFSLASLLVCPLSSVPVPYPYLSLLGSLLSMQVLIVNCCFVNFVVCSSF